MGEDVVVALRGQLRLPTRGFYGLRLTTTAPLARLAVTVGQRRIVFNNTAANVFQASLQVEDPGTQEAPFVPFV